MNSPKLFAALLVATIVVVFGAQNTQGVSFHFLMLNAPSVPLVLPLFAAILLGALLGWIVAAPGRFHRMRVRRGLESQARAHDRADAIRADASEKNEPQPTVRAV